MTTPAAADIDGAVTDWLRADPAILAALPDGVYFKTAPEGAARYAIVDLADAPDVVRVFPGDVAWETIRYEIAAIVQDSSAMPARDAAAAIRARMDDAPIPIAGYRLINAEYKHATRNESIDDTTGRRWQYIGGLYEISAQPLPED